MTQPAVTARVLVEALPYIRHFAGRSVVVKLGGNAMDEAIERAIAQDVLLLRSVGARCARGARAGPAAGGGGTGGGAWGGGRRSGGRSRRTCCCCARSACAACWSMAAARRWTRG